MKTRDQEIRDFIQNNVLPRFRAAGDLIASRLRLNTVQELRDALEAGKADGMMTVGPGKIDALRKAVGLPAIVRMTGKARITALEEALHGALCMLDLVDKSELSGTNRWDEWVGFMRDRKELWETYNRVVLGKEVAE